MSFPIKELIEFEGNIYELTCVASKRASQLAKLNKDADDDGEKDKDVSVAARQVFTHEVTYTKREK